jgi:hypothetical protein
MKLQLALVASIACALAACSGTGGPASPTWTPFGTEPAPSGGSEPAVGGPEPGTSGQEPGGPGQDPSPVSEETIVGMCAAVCARLAPACGGNDSIVGCTSDCAREVLAAGVCQPLYLDFVRCIKTAPLVCDGTDVALPDECYGSILALSDCENGNNPTPTGGGSPAAAR